MKKRSPKKYIGGALIVLAAYVIGFLTPQIFSDQILGTGGKVSVNGPFQSQGILNKAIKEAQGQLGEEINISIEEQYRGDKDLQYVVSIDGSLAALEGDELQQFGYIVTIEGDKNPFVTNVLDPQSNPDQYYVLFQEDLEGNVQLKSFTKLRE